MITANFTGNLGNHMWIYLMVRLVAEKKGYDWGFNPTPEYDYYQGKPQMDFLDVSYGKVHNYKYAETPPWVTRIWKEKYNSYVYGNDVVDYHDFQPDIFQTEPDTKFIIRCCQDARYFSGKKEFVLNLFTIKEEYVKRFNIQLKEMNIDLEDDNLVVLNIRGGEYKGVPNLLLHEDYWKNAMNIMKSRNPKAKFLAVSDDTQYANQLLDFRIPVVHLSIGGDYYIINNAKNLILSNSSFAILPAYTNLKNPYVIAPFGWARYNTTTGYWANSAIWTFPWDFLNREGQLSKGKDYA